jgi:hypothetical protein
MALENNVGRGQSCIYGTQLMSLQRVSLTVIVICGLLGNYTASCGNYLPTFRDNVSSHFHGSKFQD